MSKNLKLEEEIFELEEIVAGIEQEIKTLKFFKYKNEKEKKELKEFLRKFSELLEARQEIFLMFLDIKEKEKPTKEIQVIKFEMQNFLLSRLKMNNIFIDELFEENK